MEADLVSCLRYISEENGSLTYGSSYRRRRRRWIAPARCLSMPPVCVTLSLGRSGWAVCSRTPWTAQTSCKLGLNVLYVSSQQLIGTAVPAPQPPGCRTNQPRTTASPPSSSGLAASATHQQLSPARSHHHLSRGFRSVASRTLPRGQGVDDATFATPVQPAAGDTPAPATAETTASASSASVTFESMLQEELEREHDVFGPNIMAPKRALSSSSSSSSIATDSRRPQKRPRMCWRKRRDRQ